VWFAMASKFACDTTLDQAPAFQRCRAGPRSEIRVLVAELRAFLGGARSGSISGKTRLIDENQKGRLKIQKATKPRRTRRRSSRKVRWPSEAGKKRRDLLFGVRGEQTAPPTLCYQQGSVLESRAIVSKKVPGRKSRRAMERKASRQHTASIVQSWIATANCSAVSFEPSRI
jgi:hypothetical protein